MRVCVPVDRLDLFFAVFAPLAVASYAEMNFRFDRKEFATREETLVQGHYDRSARLFVDPAQFATFRMSFQLLQLSSTSTMAAKLSLNCLSLYKWTKIVTHLIEDNYHKHRKLVRHYVRRAPEPNKHVRRVVTLLMAGYSCTVFVYTAGALYTQCAMVSYHWNLGSTDCTCQMFVARTVAPATYASWTSPPDVTATLATLAKPGKMRVVQVVNHALPQLPDALHGCAHMAQLYVVVLPQGGWMLV